MYAPYCGLYSLYGALRVVGKAPEFEKLVDARYVGSFAGSSLGELRQAAQDQGANAVAMTGLTCGVLKGSDCPVVLHVARSGQLDSYSHWVLYLGEEAGQARIMDPAHSLESVELIPFADLLAHWDGSGLFVSSEPISGASLAAPMRMGILGCGLVLLGLVMLLHRVRQPLVRHVPWLGHTPVQAAVLLVAAGCLSVMVHRLHPEGFFRNAGATELVAACHVGDYFRKIGRSEMSQLVRDGRALVVDARTEDAFALGHIRGALNVPVNASPDEARARMPREELDRPIVVYCQSSECPWSDRVATSLVRQGYRNISIFPGGWVEWSQDEQPAP